jgi:YbbR domain-containing protein
MIPLLRRLFLHNFGLKVLSVALATGLWWLITPEQKPAEVALRVPIEFLHVPENLEISSEAVPEAQVRVRGPEVNVRQVRSTDVRVTVDLKDVKPGERTFDLSSQQVQAPRELEILQVLPGQVHLAFDTRVTREVAIRPRVLGSFAAGKQIAQVIAEPATVSITGPRGRVEKVEYATTDAVDASGVMERQTFVTNAYVSDPMVQISRPVPVRVTVVVANSPEGAPQP